MAENRQYDQEYKIQAVRLAKDIGQTKGCQRTENLKEYTIWLGESEPYGNPRSGCRFPYVGKCYDTE